jgi:hypothetical protein
MKKIECYLIGHNVDIYLDGEYWMSKCKRCGKKSALWKRNDYSKDKS